MALPIGKEQTISKPVIVAKMVEAAKLKGREKVLEIGTGSGYSAAILAQITDDVYTIGRIERLSMQARIVFERLGYHDIHLTTGDGTIGLK